MCKKCAQINGAVITKRKGRKATVDVPELVKAGVEVGVGFVASNFVTNQIDRLLPNTDVTRFSGIVKLAAGAGTAVLASRSSSRMKDDIVNVAVGMAGSGVLDIARQVLPDTLRATLGINAPVFIGPTLRPQRALAPNPVSTAARTATVVRTRSFGRPIFAQ